MEFSGHICIFRIQQTLLCVAVEQVQQIVERLPLMPMPLAPPVVRGLLNLRGQVITVLDACLLFTLPVDDGDPDTHLIVLSEGYPFSLLIDEVIDVVMVDRVQIEPSPSNLSRKMQQLTRGVLHHGEQLLLLIEPDQMAREGTANIEAYLEGRGRGKHAAV